MRGKQGWPEDVPDADMLYAVQVSHTKAREQHGHNGRLVSEQILMHISRKTQS